MSEKSELPYQHFDTSRWHACDGGAVGCWTVEVVCVVTEIVINKVEKKKKKHTSKSSIRAGLEPSSATLFLSCCCCCCLRHFRCVSKRRGENREMASPWWSFQLSKVEGGGVT